MKFKVLESVLSSFTFTPWTANEQGHYFIYKNPTSQELKSKEDSKWNRAIIDKHGDLYVEAKWLGADYVSNINKSVADESDIIHEHLLTELQKLGICEKMTDEWHVNFNSLKEGVCIQRKGDTFDFYLSESYGGWEDTDIEGVSFEDVEKQIDALYKLAKKKNPFLRFHQDQINWEF
jgi:hypothetical protein